MKNLIYKLVDLLAESRGTRQYDFDLRADAAIEEAQDLLKIPVKVFTLSYAFDEVTTKLQVFSNLEEARSSLAKYLKESAGADCEACFYEKKTTDLKEQLEVWEGVFVKSSRSEFVFSRIELREELVIA